MNANTEQRTAGHELPPARPRWRRFVMGAAVLGLVSAASGGLWLRAQLDGSLPQLDGAVMLAGLSAPVVVTRDVLGIPTISGLTRQDVARATGFLHAQERFFQMDLARRRAAGELSALVGGAALAADRQVRIHRFRDVAARAAALLAARDRALLAAYTAGVNAGLDALEAPPFEYLILRQTPARWEPEDTLLVVLSMFVTLQDEDGSYEATLATMHDVLPPQMVEFLAPRGTEWDAPLLGDAFDMPPIPGPDVYDLRTRRRNTPGLDLPNRLPQEAQSRPRGGAARVSASAGWTSPPEDWALPAGASAVIGSNSWVVSGAHTRDGRPLLANDMHLPVRVPSTWYRAVLQWPDASAQAAPRRLAGVTLPGLPALVAGSNGDIAWGFTNTYADWSDIVLLEVDPGRPERYRTPDGWRMLVRHTEVIEVAGQPAQEQVVAWTIWGPVIAPDHRGRPRAYRWVAHDADRLAGALTPLEEARTVEEAFEEANGLGVPGQNLVVADRAGSIGWSIYGALPRRAGTGGRVPASWADGTHGWNGWLKPADYPRIVNPASGRLWTANARVVGGGMLDLLGDGSYEIGSRATIIRDRLMAQDQFTRDDLLALQLDTSAVFLARWRDLLLLTLSSDAVAGREPRTLLRAIVDRGWSGQATADSVAYRLTRSFREAVSRRVLRFVLAEPYEADPSFDYTDVRRREGPIWALVTQEPHHLLDPQFDTWQELRLDAVDEVLAETAAMGDLRDRVWSEYNGTAYRHPLSRNLPILSAWLDMPAHPLPGDAFTPRVHWGTAAASQRMIVSPGYEDEGIMHMPTGQSGHPLSPFYANSHDAWVMGAPTPLLPGPTVHTLTLEPASTPDQR